jgi:FAD/FMN-containing dehydrogenase
MTPLLPPSFVEQVRSALPAEVLTQEASDLIEYGRDWTRVYPPAPSAIALPRTTAEVATLLRLCHQHGVAVVPSGGRTGLAGGAVAANGELVLSLSRMNHMEPVDTLAMTVRVQAGAVLQAVNQHCHEHGLQWPIDLAAKGSCQVGGNIATNAGGVRVIRYGLTRQWVLGLQVVTASGDILELNGALEKNNTGTDLRQLFIGSEGTLGIITEATLKLARLPQQVHVLLLAVPNLQAVLALFQHTRHSPLPVLAFEFFTQACLDRVTAHRGLRSPLPPPATSSTTAAGTDGPCYVLIELERPPGVPLTVLEDWFGAVLDAGLCSDGVLAQNPREAAELWSLRENISETLARTGLPHKNDVSLPLSQLADFCQALTTLFATHYPAWELLVFGHIGDGNLHINAMKPAHLDVQQFTAQAKQVDQGLFQLVQAHQGSVSAEHGIGLLKKDALHFSRTPQELQLLRALKQALDPRGLLNPGKIFDTPPRP